MAYLIDLHTHTVEGSSCASQTAEELISQAEEVGLDGVVVTDHNVIDGALKAQRLSRRRNVRVFVGVEVLTEELGDILVYGLRESFPDAPVSFRRLAKQAERAGAVMYAAHPFRRHARNAMWSYFEEIGFDWRREIELPDPLQSLAGVEVSNGGATPKENEEAAVFAARFRLRGIAGSDAHGQWRVGWSATDFEYEIQDEGQLVEALQLGWFRVSRNQSEFDTEAERRRHLKAMARLQGRELSDYVQDWMRKKQRRST